MSSVAAATLAYGILVTDAQIKALGSVLGDNNFDFDSHVHHLGLYTASHGTDGRLSTVVSLIQPLEVYADGVAAILKFEDMVSKIYSPEINIVEAYQDLIMDLGIQNDRPRWYLCASHL